MKAIVLMPWGRVGSNLLMGYLRKCEKGKFANETFNGIKDGGAQLAWLNEFYAEDISLTCCKQNVLSINDNPAVSAFLAENDVKVVRMFRRNLFKATLSQIRAEQYAEKTKEETGSPMWAVPKEAQPLDSTYVDPEIFVRRYKVFEDQTEVLKSVYASNVHHDVNYEDLNANMKPTLAGIAEFLDTSAVEFVPPFRKATPDDPLSVIKNAEELKTHLKVNGYEMEALMAVL